MRQVKIDCNSCGDTLHELWTTTDDADVVLTAYCDDCIVTCEDCDDTIKRDDAIYTRYGYFVCEDCHSSEYFTCPDCDEVTREGDGFQVLTGYTRDAYYCEDCVDDVAFICDNCDTRYSNNNYDSTWVENSLICDGCYSDGAFCCDGCGDNYWDTNTCSCDSDSGYIYCRDCCNEDHDDDDVRWQQRDHKRVTIHQYGYKPQPYFFKLDSEGNVVPTMAADTNKLYFGMELEVENKNSTRNRDDLAQLVIDNCDFLYNKYDGSLSSEGFEIVSDPILATDFNAIYPYDLIEDLQVRGVRSWDAGNCGIHIHMSKAAFTTAEMYKFLKFIYTNQSEVQRFAGRRTSYADFSGQNEVAMDLAKGKSRTQHFNAVNITAHTLEVRVFKGTVNTKRIKTNVEFLLALYDYVKTINARNVMDGYLAWNAFASYVKANKEKYPSLVERKEIATATDFVPTKYNFNVSLKVIDDIIDNEFDNESVVI